MLALLYSCTGCTTDLPAVQNVTEKSSVTTVSAIEIVLSHSQNINTPEDLAAKAMQTKLQQLLGEQAKVILYGDYQLGSAQEQLESTALGRIHITIQPASAVAQFVDDMQVFMLPYLFPADSKTVISMLDSSLEAEALQRINQDVADVAQEGFSFRGLGLWFGGYKLFTFHGEDNKCIHSPADFQGLTIAIPQSSLVKAQYCHWGAEPVETEAIALYAALADRRADGSEATASQIVNNYLYEVQHNIVQAYHSAEVYAVLVNPQWFAQLPLSFQDAIIASEEYAKEVLYQELAQKEAEYIASFCHADGMHYEVLDTTEQNRFRQSVIPIYCEQLAGNPWQMDFVARVRSSFS